MATAEMPLSPEDRDDWKATAANLSPSLPTRPTLPEQCQCVGCHAHYRPRSAEEWFGAPWETGFCGVCLRMLRAGAVRL